MKGILLIAVGIALTILCWGVYGPLFHRGQVGLGESRLKPLVCVGAAYFLVAIVLPVGILMVQGKLAGDWSAGGISWSMLAGAAGAIGAMGIIVALTSGGKTIYVMPLVFGGAPIVNTFLSMYWSKAWKQGVNPIFYVGLVLVIAGAATVLIYAPKPAQAAHGAPSPDPAVSVDKAEQAAH